MIRLEGFKEALIRELKVPLPGEHVQKRLSSNQGYSISELLKLNPDHRLSAVMLILWPEDKAIRCLLIRRPEYVGVHSGQMAFPGGKSDPEDLSLLQTAIRETREEVGVEIGEQSVAGSLSPIYIPVSNFLVQPYVAYIGKRPELRINPVEVQKTVDFDLNYLLEEGNIRERERELKSGLKVKTPYYEIEGFEVWGATAMILSELSFVLKKLISF